jgi:hypothetical protein
MTPASSVPVLAMEPTSKSSPSRDWPIVSRAAEPEGRAAKPKAGFVLGVSACLLVEQRPVMVRENAQR